jgi:drug/metabolite transporter (DMT)-like permease
MLGGSLSVGILLAFGTSVCWALTNVAVARSGQMVSPMRGLLWAEVFGGVLAAAAGWAFDGPRQAFTFGAAGWLLVAGVSSLAGYLCMFYALAHGRLSIVVPIMSGWAVISTLLSVAILGQGVHAAQLGGSILVVAGIAMVSRHARGADPDGHGHAHAHADGPVGVERSSVPRWVWASLGAALGFGVLIPSVVRIAPATGRVGSVAAVFGADILLALPLAALFRIDLRPPPRAALPSVAMAGLLEAAGFVCIALASARAPLAVVSPLASLSSALTVIYAWAVLRERPHPVALAGATLACAGVIAVAS